MGFVILFAFRRRALEIAGLPRLFDFDDPLERLNGVGDELEIIGKTFNFEMFPDDLSAALNYTGMTGQIINATLVLVPSSA